MKIVPLGESALIVRVAEELGAEPERTLDQVLAVYRSIQKFHEAQEENGRPYVLEAVPSYTGVTVYLDPAVIASDSQWLQKVSLVLWRRLLRRELEKADAANISSDARPQRRVVEIPVCYGREFGPDLEEVARWAELSSEEVVARHSGATYLVHCLGFTPGFPYLSGLPLELATPRRQVPRKLVPAGSVGIGGAQTGVYPLASPGGWHLLGRTPQRLFTPEGESPTLLQPGDRVRFRPISARQYQDWREL